MAAIRKLDRNFVGLLGLALVLGTGLAACDNDKDGLSNKEEEALGLNPDNEDTDGDGLLDGEEIEVGTDPLNPDSDGDYLLDGEEIANNADPMNPDTDGDGYLDGDEVLEGSSPIDSKDKIYRGNWPYNRFKDDLGQGKVSDDIAVGSRMPRFVLVDQFGETVDLYDFANQGKDVIVDLSAFNCGPCLSTAEWLDTGDDAYLEDLFGDLRKGINKDEVYWLTFVYTSYGTPTESNADLASDWYQDFKNKHIPVFADDNLEAHGWAYQGGMPFFARLNDKMIVKSFDMGIGPGVAPLEEAQDNLP